MLRNLPRAAHGPVCAVRTLLCFPQRLRVGGGVGLSLGGFVLGQAEVGNLALGEGDVGNFCQLGFSSLLGEDLQEPRVARVCWVGWCSVRWSLTKWNAKRG